MKRWAWHIFCALSLLVLAASIVIGVRSFFVAGSVNWHKYQTTSSQNTSIYRIFYYKVESTRGSIHFERQQLDMPGSAPDASGWGYELYAPANSSLRPRTSGDRLYIRWGPFQFVRWASSAGGSRSASWLTSLTLPLWLFLPAIPPWLWWRRFRRKRARGFEIQTSDPAKTMVTT